MNAQAQSRARLFGAAAALAALAVDQGSKYWLLDVFDVAARQPVRLSPFFDVVLAWNQGVSYSLLTMTSDQGRWTLLAFTLALTLGLAVWMWRAQSLVASVGLGLVVGGAIGNAFDRWSRGAVADFFFFHVGSFRWYVFNLADCAIVAGVALLLYDAYAPIGRSSPRPSDGGQ